VCCQTFAKKNSGASNHINMHNLSVTQTWKLQLQSGKQRICILIFASVLNSPFGLLRIQTLLSVCTLLVAKP
jgi:hypothetical protein